MKSLKNRPLTQMLLAASLLISQAGLTVADAKPAGGASVSSARPATTAPRSATATKLNGPAGTAAPVMGRQRDVSSITPSTPPATPSPSLSGGTSTTTPTSATAYPAGGGNTTINHNTIIERGPSYSSGGPGFGSGAVVGAVGGFIAGQAIGNHNTPAAPVIINNGVTGQPAGTVPNPMVQGGSDVYYPAAQVHQQQSSDGAVDAFFHIITFLLTAFVVIAALVFAGYVAMELYKKFAPKFAKKMEEVKTVHAEMNHVEKKVTDEELIQQLAREIPDRFQDYQSNNHRGAEAWMRANMTPVMFKPSWREAQNLDRNDVILNGLQVTRVYGGRENGELVASFNVRCSMKETTIPQEGRKAKTETYQINQNISFVYVDGRWLMEGSQSVAE